MPRVIRSTSVTWSPEARCMGNPGAAHPENCHWTHPRSRYTKTEATAHVKANPTHQVQVFRTTEDIYEMEK